MFFLTRVFSDNVWVDPWHRGGATHRSFRSVPACSGRNHPLADPFEPVPQLRLYRDHFGDAQQQRRFLADPIKRAPRHRGLEVLNRIQRNTRNEVKIHDGDFPDEKDVDAKLVRLARNLRAKLYTNDHNLGKIAELQSVNHVNLHELAKSLRTVLLPGEVISLRIAREGKDKGQGVGYLPDGTMVVVNHAQTAVGQQVDAQVQVPS